MRAHVDELVHDPAERGLRILAELLEEAAANDPRAKLRVIEREREGDDDGE